MKEKEICTYSKSYKKFIESMLIQTALNLGCGGWKMNAMNVDYNKRVKPDKLWDLNKFPYPFNNESFNSIFLIDTLEHLKYPKKVINECFRILKMNGELIIAVPSKRSEHFKHETHIQFFDKSYLKKLLANFKTKIFGYRGNSTKIPSWLGKLIGLFAEKEWICISEKVKK